jgi:hypothetical protein
MARIAIVAMGVSAHQYLRSAETSGFTKAMFDETWMVNGFGHVFQYDRMFAMDDVRVQAIRGRAGNRKIGLLVEWLRQAKGPIYTSRCLPKEPASEERLKQLRGVIDVLPNGQERHQRERELETLQVERDLVMGGGFDGLVEFPLDAVINDFRCHPYFNSTVAYAIALAAHEGHDMTIYGADYDYGPESGVPVVEKGRACCEFWIGQAVARGLHVDITRASTMMDANIPDAPYGYDGVTLQGNIANDGTISFGREDRVLPDADEIEASYFKGPRDKLHLHLADIRGQLG